MAGALLGLVAVVFAALGSHAIDMQGQPALRQIWQTASLINLFHSAALIGLAALARHFQSGWLIWGAGSLIVGTLLFCGSLYLRVMVESATTALAPLGGMILIAGWLLVTLGLLRGARVNPAG